MNISGEKAKELIRKIMPWKYIDIPEDQAQVIRARVEAEKLEPIAEGTSLHAWNVDYMVDGIRYQLIGMFGSHEPPAVVRMERRFVD